MRTETRQDFLSAEELGIKYDQSAKTIWRNREILAPLLKYSVRELENESVESIMKYIDADSISETTPVSDLPPDVIDRGTEQNSVTELPITYDLKFSVKNPRLSVGEILVMLHIDLEFQNKFYPTLRDGRAYPIIKRGIYYAARDISSQLGRITETTNYADIEKVISIWIINDEDDLTKRLQGTASRYYIEKEDFIGNVDEPVSDYDLMEVVLIRRSRHKNLTEPIFDYLKSVYEANIDEIDKYTPASANPDLKKEVEDMPGMSQVIYNEGKADGRAEVLIGLVYDGDISVDRAAEKLDTSPDEVQKLLNALIASKNKE